MVARGGISVGSRNPEIIALTGLFAGNIAVFASDAHTRSFADTRKRTYERLWESLTKDYAFAYSVIGWNTSHPLVTATVSKSREVPKKTNKTQKRNIS